tara:strand:+ start:453 stop:5207 length:4755 start_codon:yes stop_codon:yes gene_type:complete
MNNINIEDICWDILDIYFQKGGGSEASNPLVKHQIESYNKFLDSTLEFIIKGFNPIKMSPPVKFNGDNNSNSYIFNNFKIHLNVIDPSLTKPSYYLPDGTQSIMTPYIARMNNLTYSSNLYVNVHLVIESKNSDGVTEKFDKTVKNVYIGKIPIMVRSKACLLHQIPGFGEENNNECKYDYGGYFIINGNEKVLISQDRINENKTLIFKPNNNASGIYAEIRSMSDYNYLPPKTTSLNMTGKVNHMGRIIRLNTSFIRNEIPVFVMFRALNIISDKEIIEHIVYDIDDSTNNKIMNELMACCEDACDIHNKEQAENVLIRIMTGGNNKNIDTLELLRNNITNDFLPHVGKSYRRKGVYLGYMIRKMIKIHLGLCDYDNRDSYMNKRIDTPGILMSNLFRQCYGKMTKEIKCLIERELSLWRANNTLQSSSDMITDNNIHRYFKQSLLDSWLKYSLSTGNWGIKSIGSFQNIKQGVSQVLNRMSYASTLSHLRRINTSMEKNGKLVQPRKLDNSQFGMICPAETPEGASVGLVKNMALSTNISLAMSSVFIRELLVDQGVIIFNDLYTYESDNNWNISKYLKNLGNNNNNVIIIINGDIIGYHSDPVKLYQQLKHYKRCGIIYPMTGILWNIKMGEIIISTEAGRMFRPLLIVDADKNTGKRYLRISKILQDKNITWEEFSKNKSFDTFIAPCAGCNIIDHNYDKYEEGFIEYLDSDEINFAMIAMNNLELEKGMKGTSYPPFYTHCEIHPSVINGILGVNIPFSDHNQSPRNCYQCLSQNETVLLSNGKFIKIKNIKIGDKVVCFNPETKKTEHTNVINHYNKITNKIVYDINTISGRIITATNDHKFITDKGWVKVENFDYNTKIGIYMNIKDNTIDENNIIDDYIIMNNNNLNINSNNNVYFNLDILPLHNNNNKLPIIARLCGYYYINELNFDNDNDKIEFINDVKYIGFDEYNIFDIRFVIYIKKLCNDISWLNKCSNNIQKEFLSSYLVVNSKKNTPVNSFDNFIYDNNLIIDYIIEKQKQHGNDYYYKYNIDIHNNNNLEYFMKNYGIRYNNELLKEVFTIFEYNNHMKFIHNFNKNNIKHICYSLEKWKSIITIVNDICFIPYNKKTISNNRLISDITVESNNHSFIGGNGFAVSNCAMGKQALGIYMSNFNKRIDTMGNILNYPQKPLVYTKLSKYTYSNELPSGTNAIVAIMTHTGFNQEDSVMINKSSLDRGLFTSTYYKAFRDVCTKNHSTGEEELFISPESNTTNMKPFSYKKLDKSGFVPKNTFVDGNDIIIGKIMPKKNNGDNINQDCSTCMKANDEGYIDVNYTNINSEGYKFCKVRVRNNRKPEIGDKLASRSAQKGTIGMIYNHEDMPFTKDGITPDIIMNPHAIPSRMTMAQLMECIMGKAACHIGSTGDATPFTNCSVESIAKVLELSGMERYGNEIMYNGRTGEQIKTEIFIGPTYYQRLKHMVTDKLHSRGSNGPIVMLTRQPSEGRARNGGLRLGEMERDAVLSHGMSSFLKERMLDVSDNYRIFLCKNCGVMANINPDKKIYKCVNCNQKINVIQTRIPYAFKLLSQELYTMNIMMRFICN